MSSMGDVVHTLPAVTDALRMRPGISFDWVVEEGMATVAAMHPAVDQVINIALRRWRGQVVKSRREFLAFRKQLGATRYDLVIDAQGLIKSAVVALMARGDTGGYSRQSAREPVASFAYKFKVDAPPGLHAIEKNRFLFARLLDYDQPTGMPDYGLGSGLGNGDGHTSSSNLRKQVMFLHGTTWPSKHWPLTYWQELARLAAAAGYHVLLPHGNDTEMARARQIAASGTDIEVMDPGPIPALVERMRRCDGVVSVDSGLGHLACALNLPTVAIYGPTDPVLTGPVGPGQKTLVSDHLPCIPCLSRECAFDPGAVTGVYPPCFEPLTPARVWQTFVQQLATAAHAQ